MILTMKNEDYLRKTYYYVRAKYRREKDAEREGDARERNQKTVTAD